MSALDWSAVISLAFLTGLLLGLRIGKRTTRATVGYVIDRFEKAIHGTCDAKP